MFRIIVAAAMLVVLGFGAQAEPPKAGPHLSANEIRALRPTSADVWRLTYRDEEEGAAKALVLSIAPDYMAAATEAGVAVFDFRLARQFSVAGNGSTFANDSLYALVLFRIQEIANRRAMRGVLKAANVSALLSDAEREEAELSMLDLGHPLASPFVDRNAAGKHVWSRGDDAFSEMVEGPVAPEAVKSMLIRVWRHAVLLHPHIAKDVAATGRAPQSLTIPGHARDKPSRRTLTLEKAEWVEAAQFPLPSGAKLVTNYATPVAMQMLDHARAAVRDGAKAQGLAEYVRRMQASASRGQALEATLWGMEALLATGSTPCRDANDQSTGCGEFRRVMQAGMADPRATTLFGRGPLKQGTPRPDLSGLDSAYVGGLLFATRFAMGGAAGAEDEKAYLAALQNSPGVANFYKDIGDLYARNWRHPLGWQFYDMGRLLPGYNSAGTLGEIDRMEMRLRTDFPELF